METQQFPTSIKVKVLLTGTSTLYDVSSDVISKIHGEYGYSETGYTDLVARPGTLSFTMKNENGYYTFGDSYTLAGWQKGIRVHLFVEFGGKPINEFSGYLSQSVPKEKLFDEFPTVDVEITDWMQKTVNQRMSTMPLYINSKIDDGMDYLVSIVSVAPTSTSFSTGLDTFPTMFDAVRTNDVIFTEFQRLAMSEFTHIYLRMLHSDTGGEKLICENRATRTSSLQYAKIPQEPKWLLTEGLDFIYTESGVPILVDVSDDISVLPYMNFQIESGENILNDVSSRAYPRRVDTSIQTLFNLQYPISLQAGEEKVNIRGQYTDPNGGGTKINTDPDTAIPLAQGVDYVMKANQDGSGTDLTNALQLNYGVGTEAIMFNSLKNTGSSSGWITTLKMRGYGIYLYEPVDYVNENTASITNMGSRSLLIDQKYQNSTETSKDIVDILINREGVERTRIRKMYFNANNSLANMYAFLYLDIGDLVPLNFEGKRTNINADYIISRKEFDIYLGGAIDYAFEYMEFLPLVSNYWELEVAGSSELGITTYAGL